MVAIVLHISLPIILAPRLVSNWEPQIPLTSSTQQQVPVLPGFGSGFRAPKTSPPLPDPLNSNSHCCCELSPVCLTHIPRRWFCAMPYHRKLTIYSWTYTFPCFSFNRLCGQTCPLTCMYYICMCVRVCVCGIYL